MFCPVPAYSAVQWQKLVFLSTLAGICGLSILCLTRQTSIFWAGDDQEDEEEDKEPENSSSSEEASESDWDGNSDDGFKKAVKSRPKKLTKKKGKAAQQRADLNAPIFIPGAMKSELSAYEKVRSDNIKAREDMLAALMADFAD